MMPIRPIWLADNDCIDRRTLFSKLRGFLTYGSAIGKFRGIWPIIVPANRDEYVFRQDFDWVNVHDWTDPVSGPLRAYSRATGFDAMDVPINGQRRVVAGRVSANIDFNISYKAGWAWLLSHLQYLKHSSGAYQRPNPLLVSEVAGWLLGRPPQWQALIATSPNTILRTIMAASEVFLATVVVWLSTAGLLWWLVDNKVKWLGWLESLYLPLAAVIAIVVAGLADTCGRLVRRYHHGPIPRWMRVLVVAACALVIGGSVYAIGRWWR
jgi:hypothetical protein